MFAADILESPKWNLHRWAALPLRLIVGYGFMEHGYAKLIHGPERFAGILHALAVPAGRTVFKTLAVAKKAKAELYHHSRAQRHQMKLNQYLDNILYAFSSWLLSKP